MTENAPDNPFQSPVPGEPKQNPPPFPTGDFWGMSGMLVFFCLLMMASPALGIFGFMVLIPGLFRAFLVIRSGQRNGGSERKPAEIILRSLIVMLPAAIVTIICFGIVFFVTLFILEAILPYGTFDDYYLLSMVATILGSLIGLAVLGGSFWFLSPITRYGRTSYRLRFLESWEGIRMTNDDPDNPFQSPLSGEPDQNSPPFPSGLFWGVSGGLLLFCVFLLFTVPGLGIIGLFLVVPGVLRGFFMIQRDRRNQPGPWEPGRMIFISLVLMIPLYLASSVGFGIACFATAILVELMPPIFRHGNYSEMISAILGPALGVGAITFALLFWLSLTYRGNVPSSSHTKKEPKT